MPVRSNTVLSRLIPTYPGPSTPVQAHSILSKPIQSRSGGSSIALQTIHYCPDTSSPVQASPNSSSPVQNCTQYLPIQMCPILSKHIQSWSEQSMLFRGIQSCPDLSSPVQSLPILQTHPSCLLFRPIQCSSQTSSTRSCPIHSCPHPSSPVQTLPVLSRHMHSVRIPSGPVQTHPVLPWLILLCEDHPILQKHPLLSKAILSRPVLSSLVQFYPVPSSFI
jgi:hypothetical protein